MIPRRSALSYVAVSIAWMLVFADHALATQTHGQPEGLYVHQMAHVFFLISLISLSLSVR